MHTIWILPGRFGLTFGPQPTGFSNEYGISSATTAVLRQIGNTLVVWHQRKKQRTHLAELSDSLLKDIGLSHEQQRIETAKRFWME